MQDETSILIHKTIQRAKLSGLLAFAGMGLSLLQVVVGIVYNPSQVVTSLISFFISSAIGALMAFHVMRFAKQLKIGLEEDDKDLIHESVLHLKSYFKVIGVLFVILLAMILLGVLITILSFIFQLR